MRAAVCHWQAGSRQPPTRRRAHGAWQSAVPLREPLLMIWQEEGVLRLYQSATQVPQQQGQGKTLSSSSIHEFDRVRKYVYGTVDRLCLGHTLSRASATRLHNTRRPCSRKREDMMSPLRLPRRRACCVRAAGWAISLLGFAPFLPYFCTVKWTVAGVCWCPAGRPLVDVCTILLVVVVCWRQASFRSYPAASQVLARAHSAS